MRSLLFLFAIILNLKLYSQNKLVIALSKIDNYVLKLYTYDSENEKAGQASAVILSKDGVCVTNYHVLCAANRAEVITKNGSVHKLLHVIDYNKDKDIVKFKIDVTNPLKISVPLILDKTQQIIGNDVFAIGYPNSFESNATYTVSTGIISGFRTEAGNKYIQSSTPITHGSSGGGLFNYTGQLIGITTSTFAEEIKDRHANLNKVVPSSFISSLNQNKNLTLTDFNREIFDSEILVKAYNAYYEEDFIKASLLLMECLKVNPDDPFLWFRYGNSLLQVKGIPNEQERYKYAADALETSVILDSTNYFAWSKLCLAQMYIGNRDYAYYAISKAYELSPNSTSVLMIYGKYYANYKVYSNAIDYFTKAINNATNKDHPQLVAKMYLERAISSAWLNRDDQAYRDYMKALEYNSSDQEAYWWFINFLSTRKRFSEACVYCKKLKYLNPDFMYGDTHIDKMIKYSCSK